MIGLRCKKKMCCQLKTSTINCYNFILNSFYQYESHLLTSILELRGQLWSIKMNGGNLILFSKSRYCQGAIVSVTTTNPGYLAAF